jgi:hypothetical protein
MPGRHTKDPPNLYAVRAGHGCVCGKRMLQRENEGTCLWCGHGAARPVVEHAYRRNMERNDVPVAMARPRLAPTLSVADAWDRDTCAAAALRWEAAHGAFPSSVAWNFPKRGEQRPSTGTIYALFGSWGEFKRYCADIPRDQVLAAAA